jgi:hypothetical protein
LANLLWISWGIILFGNYRFGFKKLGNIYGVIAGMLDILLLSRICGISRIGTYGKYIPLKLFWICLRPSSILSFLIATEFYAYYLFLSSC